VVGHGDGRHVFGPGFPDQGIDLVGSVQEAVLGMNMQMNKLVGGGHQRSLLIFV
jgi:hypothetical protein